MDCMPGNDLRVLQGANDDDLEECKTHCADDPGCRAFALWQGQCYVKPYVKARDCEEDLHYKDRAHTYLKERN